MAKKRRRRDEDNDDDGDNVPQKSVRFDDSFTGEDAGDDQGVADPAPAEDNVDKGSRLTREEDDEEDDIAPRKGGGMAGNDDSVDVKIVGGRITKVEGEEDADFGEDFEEGGVKIIPFNLNSVWMSRVHKSE